MTLLSIIAETAGGLNQPIPTVLFGSSLPDAILWRTLALREGRELSKRHDWQALIVEQTWTTTATEAQASALPSDYDHLPPDPEVWNRTGNQRLTGPLSSRDWTILQNSSVTGGTAGWWRIIGGELNIYPAPSAGLTYALEYVSKNWCESSLAVGQSAWAADTDVPLLPADLIVLGVTWRFLRSRGMDYAEEMATYEREVEKASGRDRGSNVLVVGGSRTVDHLAPPYWSGTIS